MLAERMKMHGLDYLVIATNLKSHKIFESRGLEPMHSEFVGSKLYEKLGIKSFNPVVILNDLDSNKTEMVRRFKQNFKHDNIVTLSNRKLENGSGDSGLKLVDRQAALAETLEAVVVRPHLFQSINADFGALALEEITMTNQEADRKRVRDFAFHPSGSLIMLRRNKEIFIPHGDTHLLLGDIVTVIGNAEALQDFRLTGSKCPF